MKNFKNLTISTLLLAVAFSVPLTATAGDDAVARTQAMTKTQAMLESFAIDELKKEAKGNTPQPWSVTCPHECPTFQKACKSIGGKITRTSTGGAKCTVED